MKYKLILDEKNYLTGFVHTDSNEDKYELNPQLMKLDYLNCYKLVGDEVVFDEEKYKSTKSKEDVAKEVARLKEELSSTDYKIIKCSEYQLVGLEMPYDVIELHRTKQELRDKINELEN